MNPTVLNSTDELVILLVCNHDICHCDSISRSCLYDSSIQAGGNLIIFVESTEGFGFLLTILGLGRILGGQYVMSFVGLILGLGVWSVEGRVDSILTGPTVLD